MTDQFNNKEFEKHISKLIINKEISQNTFAVLLANI